MTYEAIWALSPENSVRFDLSACLIAVILVVGINLYRHFLKKPISPIRLIVASACLGMLFYGL